MICVLESETLESTFTTVAKLSTVYKSLNFLVHTESQAKKCVPENGKEKDPFEPLAVADPD